MPAAKRITTAEAATLRGVTRGRVFALYKAGRLKGEMLAGRLTFRESDVLKLDTKPVGRPRNEP